MKTLKPLRGRGGGDLCGRKGFYVLIAVVFVQALAFLILLFYKTNCSPSISNNTIKNLEDSFAGESQARNRYMFFAEQARKEGYVEIALKLEDIANQEVLHARSMYKILNGGGFRTTKENLEEAVEGEGYEEDEKYPMMAKIAREEGMEDAAKLFENIHKTEGQHKKDLQWFLKSKF